MTLGTPVIPPGKIKEDEFFGKVQIFRKNVSVDVPLTVTGSRPEKVNLQVTSQGCADLGVCYPPYTHKVQLDLPSLTAVDGRSSTPDALQAALDAAERAAYGTERAPSSAEGNARGDAQAMPFADRSFDVVTAWHVIEHVADVTETLADWRRVLRPGRGSENAMQRPRS